MIEESNTNSDPSAITNLLAEVCALSRQRSRELLHKVGLHRGWHHILRQLWRQDGLMQTDLVRQGHVKASTVSKTAQRMEEVGLITRRRDSTDQRVVHVYLTDSGRAVEDAAEELRSRIADEALAGLDMEERATLEHLLGKVRGNLESSTSLKSRSQHRGGERPASRPRRGYRQGGR